MSKLKILHITDLHFRHNGRLFYSTGKKINNGLILNGHNVLNISDRDITNQKRNILDIGSKKYLNDRIIQNIEKTNHVKINQLTLHNLNKSYIQVKGINIQNQKKLLI